MSDTIPRANGSRGRASHRGGRGGFGSRGGGRSNTRGTAVEALTGSPAANEPSLEDQGELGQLKKRYMGQISQLKEMFPDWTDDDLVFALQESDGDMSTTIEKITEGNVSQFSDVKKKTREKSRAKVPEAAPTSTEKVSSVASRGRGRGGADIARGGRGRDPTRGGRGGRGARNASSSNLRAAATTNAATTNSDAASWDATAKAGAIEDIKTATPDLPATNGQWGNSVVSDVQSAATEAPTHTSTLPAGQKKSWASMLAQPKVAPVLPKAAANTTVPSTRIDPPSTSDDLASSAIPSMTDASLATPTTDTTSMLGPDSHVSEANSVNLTPPRDQLTEDNLEQLPDNSIPPGTETVASTRDPSSVVGSATPSVSHSGALLPQSASKPPLGGYATTAWKATATPGRSASYNRRMLEQQEAVVMPGSSHAVDRAAVQFGSLGLGGENAKPLDVDDDREEPETRAQPPQQSPSAPRASLPPVMPRAQAAAQEIPASESIPTPKATPGYPTSVQPPLGASSSQLPSATPAGAPGLTPASHNYNQQYGRYGGSGLGQDAGIPQQKPYDPFGQQLGSMPSAQSEQSSMYGATTQTHPSSTQQPTQSHVGGISGVHDNYGSSMGDPNRNQQSYYTGAYGQGAAPGLTQDASQAPQRAGSAYGASDATYGASQHAQARYGEAHNSGSNTPQPTGQTSGHASHQQQHQQQHHMQSQGYGQGGWGGAYNGHQYGYNQQPQFNQYMNQYGNAYNGYGQHYGGQPYGNKGYGQHHQQQHPGYGMPHQSGYEHSSSPANVGGYGSSLRGSESAGYSSSIGDYNRSGSAQQTHGQHSSSTAGIGGMNDAYGRSASGLSHQTSGYGQQSGDDGMKGYPESKTGPSPSLSQQGRAGSALGNAGQYGNQSGYPTQGSHQQQNYQGHLNSYGGSYGGGLGGLGGHQGSGQGQSSNYSGGYSSFGTNNYGGNNYGGRNSGWGGQYGQGSGSGYPGH